MRSVRVVARSASARGRLVDRVRVYARGGAGGQGYPRLGGVGGDGGSVIVRATRGSSLVDVARMTRRRFIGDSGSNSRRQRLQGKRGRDVTIRVPPGTVVLAEDGSQLTDLDRVGEEYLLARGGMGGRPGTLKYEGQRGQRCVVTLELKLIADVGMVGFPNAGKSTLLRAISRATPKVADYPFTTLRPQLGVVDAMRGGVVQKLTVADLPGLVEGAHINVGMGHKFLRHIERTKALLFVIDITGFQLSPDHPFRGAAEAIQLLHEELEHYQEGLSSRPAVLVVNKMDLPNAADKLHSLLPALQEHEQFSSVVLAAAKFGVGVDKVTDALMQTLYS